MTGLDLISDGTDIPLAIYRDLHLTLACRPFAHHLNGGHGLAEVNIKPLVDGNLIHVVLTGGEGKV